MAVKKKPAPVDPPPPSNNKFKDIIQTTQNINQRLQKSDGLKNVSGSGSNFHMFDIIKSFDWTTSNVSQIYDDVPYILLQEFKIAANSQMASLITNAMAIPDIIGSSKSSLDKFGAALANKASDTMKDNAFSNFMEGLKKTAGGISDKISKGIEKGNKAMENFFSGLDNTTDSWADQTLAAMYKFLYIRKATNRWYKFPYYNSSYYDVRNSFKDTASDTEKGDTMANLMGEGAAKVLKDIGKFTNITALTEPGSYVQRTQFYDFAVSGPEFSVTFFLYNTINEDAFVKNNIFLQTLIIQNTAHRHNRLLVDPPCIYECTIPGRGFYPYVYIQNINVKYKGTQRILGGDSGKQIIVPDAYEVSLTLKSLTTEVNNFLIPEFYDGMSNLANERGNAITGEKTADKSNANTTQIKSTRSNRGANSGGTIEQLLQSRNSS
jgi:hypothetical protein